MIQTIDIQQTQTLEDYAVHLHLSQSVLDLEEAALSAARLLKGRTVWMVNSTATGGGVAEMLPKLVMLLRELGVHTEWVVIGSDEPDFFTLTKRLHNLMHGIGNPNLTADDRALYESVSRELADAFRDRIGPNDILVIHDPQPLGMGALLKQELDVPAIWRSHIGLDRDTPTTRAAWDFLKPWLEPYDRTVFTVRDYVPPFLSDCAYINPPAIDPLSPKNRELSIHKLAGILSNAALTNSSSETLTPPYEHPAERLQPDGSFAPATQPDDIGLMYRPIVTQISRWDRLKGFKPLLEGFAHLKKHRNGRSVSDDASQEHRRRLDLLRLVLAGPDPQSIQDDPEGLEVFNGLCQMCQELDPEVQRDVAVVVLPMESRRINALMVNALQRCSTVVAQNSLQEGFGLTVTEAMWKRRPVLGTRAVGIRQQVRDGVDGRLLDNPTDPEEIAVTLDEMLANRKRREQWSFNAQRRVADHYLVFAQVRRWLDVLAESEVHNP